MLRKEWPLIMSTLLAQLAAGMFIILAITRIILINSNNQGLALELTPLGIALVGPIIALGMVLSLFHLGNPLRAYRSISNIGQSWLSWEVFFSAVFLLLWFACFWLDGKGMTNPYLLAFTGLAGVLNVYSMANIYFQTGRDGWARSGTFVSFFVSLIVLGTLSSVLVFGIIKSDPASIIPLSLWPAILSLLALALELISLLLFLPKHRLTASEDSLDLLVSSAALNQGLTNRYYLLKILGWALSLLGVTYLFIHLHKGEAGVYMVLTSLILAFSGQLIERFAFFTLGMGEERLVK